MHSPGLHGISHRLQTLPPHLAWLMAAITLSVLPHFLRVPLWIPVMFCLIIAWRLYVPLQAQEKSTRFVLVKSAFAVTMLAGIFITYGTLTGRDAGVALLILLSAMKLIELRAERDYYIALFIALLLILTQFLYSQTIFTAAYMGVAVVVVVGALIGFNDRNRHVSTPRRLRLAGGLLLQALPLALLLFLFFPRAPGPLWGMPRDARGGVTSIDDQMSPGALSRLSMSNAVAFRVEFQGKVPPRNKLYWRGPVLWFTDGFKWMPEQIRRGRPRVKQVGDPVHYTVTLEPTDKHWLFALEMPTAAPAHAHYTRDMQLRTRRRISVRRRYTLTSYLDYRLMDSGPGALKRALQLPPGRHAQAVALGRRWARAAPDAEAVVRRALKYFHDNDFYYTLTPPPLLNDTVDQFLFQTRKGFCEHYAAAFTILMRAAGIPTRVVLGYQGGRVNPVGGYLVVRQRDAHAWTEVWLGATRGWVRVDPTAAVSPDRVSRGIESALPNAAVDVPLGLQGNSTLRAAWQELADTWDAINNRWNQWVLGYNRERQYQFLRRIGLEQLQYRDLLLGITFTILAFLGVLALQMFRRTAAQGSEARYWYERFRRRLSRCGIAARDWEGPLDFAARAARRRRDLAAEIDRITDSYVAVRYGGREDLLNELKARVRGFKPKRQ